jgi:hypothetical protein
MDRVVVALFNPWLFKGRDELVAGFFNALRAAMGRSRAEEARELVESVDRYWGAIDIAGHGLAAIADFHGGSGAATTGWKAWGPRLRGVIFKPKPRSPDEERLALERKIAEARCAVVVLIDELDRVEDDEVRAVAQLVKAVGDIKGVSYLVAYDADRVVQALGRGEGDERRRSGEHYLEKIIQHPIPLRPLFTEDTKALLEAALADHEVEVEEPRTESQRKLLDHLIETIETPREVKRLVGAFSVLKLAVHGEICPYDVLGYCWILTKSPGVRDRLVAHVDDLVSDPSEMSLLDREVRRMNNEAEPDVVAILGEEATVQRKTLELLFPRLMKDSDQDDGDRLSKRRNLVRMLYLGNPPGMVRRNELEALWNNIHLDQQEAALRIMLEESKLAAALDRLSDLLPSLPASGDQNFWVALSRVLHRRTDWLTGPEAARALADDAATALYWLGRDSAEGKARLRTVIDALARDGDLVLVPWMLRKHLYAHGLTTRSEPPRGGEVFDKKETEELLARELPRYRQAVIDGTALRRLPDLEAVFVIVNTGHWDKDLRAALTAQLDTMQAISTFAGLMVPPGFTANRTLLDELVDANTVQARFEAMFACGDRPSNPWLDQSLRRLLATFAGRDPMFDLD